VVKSGRLPDPEPQAFVSHIADAFLTTALRQAWILLPAANNAMELAAQLGARGWAVTRSCQSMGELLDAMSSTERGPELLFTGVRLPDGDAFELIRRLAARRHAPALFFVTRQQRAVIKAAVSLCEHYGLTVAGQALAPMNIELVLRQIELFRLRERRAASPRKLPPVPQIDQLEEFVLKDGVRAFLQPKLRLSSGQVVGFESLMRAIGPDGQIIHPQALIEPLAAAGLLPAATLQMFSQTVAFLRKCLDDGIAVGASVNVPLSLVSDREFCECIVEIVERVGLDPSWLTVEITESEAMSDLGEVIENTSRIRMYGFNLSIDDFGTAYSSFTQLTKIPFSELKIERSFITGIESDKSKQAVVSACALLGSRLGLNVVAEGIETLSELASVRESGCSEIQGYIVGRPLPAAHALAWIQSLDDQRFPLPDVDLLQSWAPSV
jgi:EAL domain-containing protein (putative c-di-GMP-specific phosphodiesterase class I)